MSRIRKKEPSRLKKNRKRYSKPQLKNYGTVEGLTTAKSGGAADTHSTRTRP